MNLKQIKKINRNMYYISLTKNPLDSNYKIKILKFFERKNICTYSIVNIYTKTGTVPLIFKIYLLNNSLKNTLQKTYKCEEAAHLLMDISGSVEC